jgi:hypothetical protein
MVKRIIAIVFIFGCAAVAWMVLGATIFARTQSSDSTLKGRVASTWGTAQKQAAPSATTDRLVPKQIETTEGGRTVIRTVEQRETLQLPLDQSRINVDLKLEHRRKGLLWYATYGVTYAGTYRFHNTTARDSVTFTLPFPASRAIYDNLTFAVNGTPVSTTSGAEGTSAIVRIAPGERATLAVGYRSQGLGDWRYEFGGDVAQVRDFDLEVTTNFKDVDFADNTPPKARRQRGGSSAGATPTSSPATRSASSCRKSSSPAPSPAGSASSRQCRCSSSSSSCSSSRPCAGSSSTR